jgi:hypothetical protein
MLAPTCFGITLPPSGSVPSAFWEKLNWGVFNTILWMGVLCLVTWCSRMHVMKPTWCTIYFQFIRHYTSTCFGLASCPSSGGSNVYKWQLILVSRTSATDTRLTRTVAYIHRYLLMMGYQQAQNMQRCSEWLKLQINGASGWFHYTHACCLWIPLRTKSTIRKDCVQRRKLSCWVQKITTYFMKKCSESCDPKTDNPFKPYETTPKTHHIVITAMTTSSSSLCSAATCSRFWLAQPLSSTVLSCATFLQLRTFILQWNLSKLITDGSWKSGQLTQVYPKIGNFWPYSCFISYLIYSQSSISVVLNFYSV